MTRLEPGHHGSESAGSPVATSTSLLDSARSADAAPASDAVGGAEAGDGDGRSVPEHVRLKRERERRARGRRRVAGRVVGCVLVGAALAVPALFVNDAIGYAPFISYLFVLLLSFAYVMVLKRGLTFTASGGGGECERGDRSAFTVTVKNDSLLPAIRIQVLFYLSDLFGGEGAVEAHNLTLGPRCEKTYDFGTRFNHIGTYQVGVREFAIYDLIGVFSSVRVNDELSEVRVLPRLFDVSDLPISTDSAVEAKHNFTTVINDGMDYSSVREYQWGDPIKSIHWKLSSRLPGGDYLTRLYETNANPGMTIIADFDAPEYGVDELMSIYDTVVECAFSIERFADSKGLDAELIFKDKEKNRRRYYTPLVGKRRVILEVMPKIFSPGSGREALSLIREEMSSTFAQTNFVICTSVISEDLIESLASAKAGKRTPMLLAIVPKTADEERVREMRSRLKRLGAAGVYYRIVSDATALEGVG